ncbi:hypothetical protein GGF46_004479 [Coemansia sp. RSA 552]|nr:hypothetical protein GGF46_004479 [Coemansia sp. RSA 552]
MGNDVVGYNPPQSNLQAATPGTAAVEMTERQTPVVIHDEHNPDLKGGGCCGAFWGCCAAILCCGILT